MDFEILLEKNPWWRGKKYFKEDVDYKRWKDKKIRWTPEIVKKIEMNPFSLHFVFGPRQVGKTTALKLLIKKLLKERKETSIFYFRCDEIGDYKELKEVIEEYLNFKEKEGIESSVFLLDEITYPDEWWRAIKGLIDDGVFENDVLILTGSASIETKKQKEYFPGRRGEGEDFEIYPLSFKKFVEVVNPKLAKKLKKDSKKNMVHLKDLNKLFEDYLRCGGFPLAVNSYYKKGYVDEKVKETYLTWTKNDLARAGKDGKIAREIMKVLLRKAPSPISYENISKETSIKSPKTISSYLHTLSDIFILEIAHFIDPNKEVIKFGKNKKIHLLDPLLFEIFEDWGLVKIKERESLVAEAVLANHLNRKYGEVFYWRNKEEIDCVVKEKNKLLGYECKWRKNAKEKKLRVGKLKEIKTVSKKDFGENMVPISLFLWSL